MPYEAVPAGSLDIETAHVRLGRVDIEDLDTLRSISSDYDQWGNKFITAEHFAGMDDKPIDAEQFDVRTMCLSLFVAPIRNDGRHRNILPYHQRRTFSDKTGRITGGGLIAIEDNALDVQSSSGDYQREPDYLRATWAQLLRDALASRFGAPELTVGKRTASQRNFFHFGLNEYWLRYRQVLEQAREELESYDFKELVDAYDAHESLHAQRSQGGRR